MRNVNYFGIQTEYKRPWIISELTITIIRDYLIQRVCWIALSEYVVKVQITRTTGSRKQNEILRIDCAPVVYYRIFHGRMRAPARSILHELDLREVVVSFVYRIVKEH